MHEQIVELVKNVYPPCRPGLSISSATTVIPSTAIHQVSKAQDGENLMCMYGVVALVIFIYLYETGGTYISGSDRQKRKSKEKGYNE
jgi:hypothetical protein